MRKKSIVIVADVFAMIYVGFTFADALIRCRFKHVRILDEIVLVSTFFSLWCFTFTAFKITSLVGVTIGFLIVFAIICYRGVFAMKRRTDPRVARLIESISDLNTLQAMALMAVVLKPDDAETEEIFGAAMARAAAAAIQSETPSVYHSPRRSSSFAGNSSPLPPSTVVSVANLCEMVKKLQV